MGSRYADKVVIVTGGSSGIGKGCAYEFVRAGAKVVVCCNDEEGGRGGARGPGGAGARGRRGRGALRLLRREEGGGRARPRRGRRRALRPPRLSDQQRRL